MKHLSLIVLAWAGLTGCLGSAPPVPRDHYYRVMVAPPRRTAACKTASIEGAMFFVQPCLGQPGL